MKPVPFHPASRIGFLCCSQLRDFSKHGCNFCLALQAGGTELRLIGIPSKLLRQSTSNANKRATPYRKPRQAYIELIPSPNHLAVRIESPPRLGSDSYSLGSETKLFIFSEQQHLNHT